MGFKSSKQIGEILSTSSCQKTLNNSLAQSWITLHNKSLRKFRHSWRLGFRKRPDKLAAMFERKESAPAIPYDLSHTSRGTGLAS